MIALVTVLPNLPLLYLNLLNHPDFNVLQYLDTFGLTFAT